MMKKNHLMNILAIILVAMGAMVLKGCGGGGTDSVLAPTNNTASTTSTTYTNTLPEAITATDAATITAFDTTAATTFYGGTTIATSGATFLDMATCAGATCHKGTYDTFLQTNHNLAWAKKSATFATYVASGRTYCVQCHTVTAPFKDLDNDHVFDTADGEYAPFGLSVSTTAGTFGGAAGSTTFTNVNNVPTEFQGIQCENCHGPASLHNGTKANIVAGWQAYSARSCDFCHDQYEEWEKSGHSGSKSASHGSASCTPCHTAEGFVEYVGWTKTSTNKDILYYIDQSGARTVTGAETEGNGAHSINCAACHDPHQKDYEYQLRVDKADLCITCHNSRKKLPGDSHAPHHDLQGRVLNGQGLVNTSGQLLWDRNGYLCSNNEETTTTTCGTNKTYQTIATDIKPVMGSSTTCVDCHMYSYTSSDRSTIWLGHTFKPHSEKCKGCHTSMSPDAVISNIQSNFAALYNPMKVRLDAATAALDTDASGTVNSTDTITAAQLKAYNEALWNMQYIEYDGSKGVHNFDVVERSISYTDTILKSLGF